MKWFSVFSSSIEKVGFEDIKHAIQYPDKYIIINTLDEVEQHVLIKGTTNAVVEERVINNLIDKYSVHLMKVIIYGKNDCDESVERKCSQLKGIGFADIFVYVGGLFDWLLLQEIYGPAEFPTIGVCKDLLRYRPVKKAGVLKIGY